MALVTFAILFVVALVLTIGDMRKQGGFRMLAGPEPSWGVGFFSLLGTASGIFLSYLAFRKGLSLSLANIAGAIGVTVVANLGTFATRSNSKTFGFLDFLAFVKDGFLWTTAYPTLATALGEVTAPKS
jgi:hypothetical protein